MNYHDHAAMSTAAALNPNIEEFADKLGDEAYIKEYMLYRTGTKYSCSFHYRYFQKIPK